MSARAKPPVQPLSRPAWDRIESRLFERLDRGEHLLPAEPARPERRPVRLWASVAGLAAAAALALWWQTREPAEVAQHAAPPAAVAERPAPREPAHIVTTYAPTRTTMGEATLTLAAQSEVHVDGSDNEGWLVRLDRGEVECEVAPRKGRPPFVVQAGETRVTVVGTRFTVERDGFGARVSVSEGRVQVSSGAEHVSLGPGDEWPPEPPALVPEELPELDEPPLEPPPKATKKRPRRAVQGARGVGEQFERAARLEASDPDAAAAIYRKLAAGKGHWAANALYAHGRLELERGHTDRARKLLERYLARHPSGANASDVRALLAALDSGNGRSESSGGR